MDDGQKIAKIADTCGYDAQSRQCIEEMAELTQAINKFWRKVLECGKVDFKEVSEILPSFTAYNNLVEELADVQIMVFQMAYLLNVENIKEVIQNKIDRQIEKIKNKESEEI